MHVKVVCIYKIFTALIVASVFLLSSSVRTFANSEGSITATVSISVCGNGVVEYGEICDTTNLNGKTCTDFGYEDGVLQCGLACDEYNTNYCFNESEEDTVEDFVEEVEEEDHELSIEVKNEEVSDSVESLSVEILPIDQIESIEFLPMDIDSQDVLLSEAPP